MPGDYIMAKNKFFLHSVFQKTGKNRQKPAKTGKIHILGSVDRMIFIYGLINGKYCLFIDISH